MANYRMMRRVAYIAVTFLVATGWLQGLFSLIPFSPVITRWVALGVLTLIGVIFRKARLTYKLPLFFLLSQLFFWEISDWMRLSAPLTGLLHLGFLIALLLVLEGKRAMRLCCPGKLSDRVYITRRLPGFLGKMRWTKLSLIGALALYVSMSLAVYLSRGNWGPPRVQDPLTLANGLLSALITMFYHFVGPLLLIEERLDEDSVRLLLIVFYAFPFSGLLFGIISIVYAWSVVRSLQETRGLLAAVLLTLGHAMGVLFPLQGLFIR